MKKDKARGFLFYMIPILLLTGVVVFSGLFLRELMAYRTAEQEYASLKSLIQEETVPPEREVSESEPTEAKPESEEYFPALSIDYEALSDINPDFTSVLYVPALSLQYPVVHSKDNADYLHRTFEGKNNFAGSVFLDANADGSYEESNTFLFGHNMKNGSMFGTLKRFLKEPALVDEDPYVYIYTAECVRKYRIFSYYNTVTGSPAYEDILDNDGYRRYVERALRSSAYIGFSEDTVDFSDYPGLLTLSTCAGRSGGNERMLLHAALVAKKSNKQ